MSYEFDLSGDGSISKAEDLKDVVKMIEEDIFVNSEEHVRFNYINSFSTWTLKMLGYCFSAFFLLLFLFFSFFGWWFIPKVLVGGFISFIGTIGVNSLVEDLVILRFYFYEKSIKKMLSKFSNADEFAAFMAASLSARRTNDYNTREDAKKAFKEQISKVYDGVSDYYKTGKISSSAKIGLTIFVLDLSEDVSSFKKSTLRYEKFGDYVENAGDTLRNATTSYLGKGKEKSARDSLMTVERLDD